MVGLRSELLATNNFYENIATSMIEKNILNPQNYAQIYNTFEKFEPNPTVQRLGFLAMSKLYESELVFKNGSDEIIENHLNNGGNLILTPNHQSNADIPTVAALAHTKTFDKLRGNTIIPAKVDMFKWPLVGRFIPHMQAHPTFRSKDFDDSHYSRILKMEVTESLMRFNINKINKGSNLAMFPEGTRNQKNLRDVQPLKSGLARIALGVKDPSNLLIVPLGFSYRKDHPKRSPVAVVPSPISPQGFDDKELLQVTRAMIQEAVSEAFDITEK